MRTRLVGRARTLVGDNRSSAATRLAITGVALVVVGAYVAFMVLYSRGAAAGRLLVEKPLSKDGTAVTLEVDEVQSNNTVLAANLTVLPGPQLLDPVTHSLKENLSVAVTSVARPTNLT